MNVKTKVLYGKSDVEIDVPDHSTLIEPSTIPPLDNDVESIMDALTQPIASPPLHTMVKATDKVAIVISDITRPTPNHILVPCLLRALSHVPKENFVIINGTGTHRDQTREELVQMLGEDIVANIRIVHNHCHDYDSLTKVGHSKYGCDVYLNKDYVAADFKITTGFIEGNWYLRIAGCYDSD